MGGLNIFRCPLQTEIRFIRAKCEVRSWKATSVDHKDELSPFLVLLRYNRGVIFGCATHFLELFDQPAAGMSEDQFDVVVVGAGLSGLSAARRLQKRNAQLRVLVLEARGVSLA